MFSVASCFAFAALLALLLHHFLIGGLLADAGAQLLFGFLHGAAHGLAGDKQRVFAVFAAREIHAAQIGGVDFACFEVDVEAGGVSISFFCFQ